MDSAFKANAIGKNGRIVQVFGFQGATYQW